MLSENRIFHCVGKMKIKKSKLLRSNILPIEDEVNWMFLVIGDYTYSFVYKFEDPENAQYDVPFSVKIAFTFFDLVKDKLVLNHKYTVLRGQEEVGTIILEDFLLNE
ncbi:hypothetical protein [Chryseobacterium sp. Leaf201]|uniref:hypothetical protein n=1 Tax=Chryseobacterium sp. Leaf201 TaxID=1735672 RepID=UPI000ABA6A59|nr:hypothetical protein [Chryseobacterium sp. Leaf201]